MSTTCIATAAPHRATTSARASGEFRKSYRWVDQPGIAALAADGAAAVTARAAHQSSEEEMRETWPCISSITASAAVCCPTF